MNLTLISVLMGIFFSIIVIWRTSSVMIEKKKILFFMPFFIFGLTLSFYSAFYFYAIYDKIFWLFYELLLLVAIIWIFINLRRKEKW
jgi:hypothetical protein